jgi:hypothetical protein
VPFLDVHQIAQRFAPAGKARADCSNWHLENRRSLVVAYAFEPDEQNDVALLLGQLPKRMLQLAQLTRSRRISCRNEGLRTSFQIDGCTLPYGMSDLVNVLIVHNGKEPRAQIGAGLP